ncbi:hypothetical protein BV898_03777 [Hypsibius exemplaris]|uniref:C4H2-type domain-containing protein n=1 Tax=Hypsibius exemplaris TaxID=2072580 RepID=A0A1W0X4K3_HYPEX|nr:hypothetical protein BV898_03777 [Hypsibius exemplaris]
MCDQQEDWLYKLETLRDLKGRHDALLDVTERLRTTHNQLKTEEKNRADYKSETSALEAEKNELIDRLRKVNKDLEDMNAVEKGSNEYLQRLSKSKDHLVDEYLPLKDDVDRLRASLDVERSPDLADEGIDIPTYFSVRVENQPHFSNLMMSQTGGGVDHHGVAGSYGAFHPCMPTFNNPLHHHASGGAAGGPANSLLTNVMANSGNIGLGDSGINIKQRTPPMKKCPTCGNDIHRNAPICPICKSKSHSKNPKKSKKKQTDKMP